MKFISYPLAAIRLVVFITVTFLITLMALAASMLGFRHRHVFTFVRPWQRISRAIVNLQVEYTGNQPDKPGIIMPNHRSYLDILILPAQVPFVFVAKREVSRWPIIGWGATVVGTVYVDRKSANSRREIFEQLRNKLQHGDSVLLFPEGTTAKGPDIKPLKPSMFRVVAENPIPLYRVAIEYENPDLAWVDDDLFIPHFFRHLGRWRNRVRVHFGEPSYSDNAEALIHESTEWYNQQLAEMRHDWANNKQPTS